MPKRSFIICAACMILAPCSASADLLPGGHAVPTAVSALPAGAYIFAPTTVHVVARNALNQINFTGNLTYAVWREQSTGFLDFLYQFHNDSTSKNPVEHISTTDFATVTTNVEEITGTAPSGFVLGSVVPDDATRSPGDGGVVAFNFPTPHSIPKNGTTRVLVISTNATQIEQGTTSLIDGAVATVITEAPVPIPEPGSLTLVCGGVLGLAGVSYRRRRLLPS